MIETIRGLKTFEIILNNGVDEVSPVTRVAASRLLTMENWRVSQDGLRIEKRNGLGTAITSTPAVDIYGYQTYYDSTPNFCQLIIAEDKIWRKTGAGAWGSIHTWSSTLTYPLKVIEIQGKQLIINDIQNRMILPAGTFCQLGISAPATIPTFVASFDSTLLDEDMAVITDWTDEDAGAGASSQVTFDAKSCMRLLNTGVAGDIAKRSRTISNISPEFSVEFYLYVNTLGIYQDTNYFEINIFNGRVKAQIRLDMNDLYVYSGEDWVSCAYSLTQDSWHLYKFYLNTNDPEDEYVEIYIDGASYGHYSIAQKSTSTPGKVELSLYGSSVATDCYIDYIKIGSTLGGNLAGLYRYAVTYCRSGNYGAESNPIKSVILTAAFTGTGLNDLTPGGSYTGEVTKTIRVKIDATGTPDTIAWSEDGGVTWRSTGIQITTTTYLSYGIELTFGATTGHTLNDYWVFTCYAMSVDACHQKVSISSIPLSSDTQVDQRKIYRTLSGGSSYFLVATINNNTTTTFVDNIPDEIVASGTALEEDHDIAPLGKYATWWDDRLWILDDDENIVYYSAINKPEHFDISARYISIRGGEAEDVGTGLWPYKGHLYAFKRNSIFLIRKRLGGTYGRYEVCKEYGNLAPSSLEEAYGLLMFLSFRGWEVFNGCPSAEPSFSLPIMRTLKTIDKTNLKYITTAHNRACNEVWLSIPDRTGGSSAITAVFNYIAGAFYFFSFPKVPSCLVAAKDSSKDLQVYMGTRDGYLYTCESGTQDGTTNITATARTGWYKFPAYQHIRRQEIEYQCPTGNTLTVAHYVNFQKTAKTSRSLTGVTPTSTDIELRRPLQDYLELALRGQDLSASFVNSENVGSALKIHSFKFFYADITKKRKISPD